MPLSPPLRARRALNAYRLNRNRSNSNRKNILQFDVESLEDRRLLTVIADGGFENNSPGQWYGLGGNLVVSEQAARSGGSSALATNRTVDWNGIGRNLLGTLQLDTDYKFSTYVRLKNAGSETVYFGVGQTDDRGTIYDTLRETTVTANGWTKLEGGFRFASSGNTTELNIYVGGPTVGVEFYVDDFTINEYDWRADTNAKIEQVRKSNASINVFDSFGNALNGVTVELRQISAPIELGSAFLPLELDNQTYRDFFLDHFEYATVEAFGHWYSQETVQDQNDFSITDELADFFRASGLKGHGHTVFYGDDDTRPPWLDDISDQELFQEMIQRVNDAVSRYGDIFDQWDVNNEMVKAQYFQDRLGDWIHAWMFNETRLRNPDAQLFVNEFSAIASGEEIDAYKSLIEDLLSRGAPVGAIGFQSHFNHTISSWDIQTSARMFTEYGIPLWSTEFDVLNTSDAERAKDVEVFFRTVMSMPEFEGVTLWGVWEGSQWRGSDASLFEVDWSPNASGQMYLDLWDEWSTEVTGTTGAGNRFDFRGFHGDYEVLISQDGRPAERHFISLDAGTPQASFDLVLPTSVPQNVAVASRDIQIRAAGTTGTERMQLLIDGQVVRSWNNIRGNADNRQFIIRNYTHSEAVSADRISVAFANDGTAGGRDRNLAVDQIRVGSAIYESESASVYSVGSWSADNGCGAGYKQSETLNCNGFFRYGGSSIEVLAAGATGEERIQLQVEGQAVAEYQVTGGDFVGGSNYQRFTFQTESFVAADQVRVVYVNDGTSASGADRNVRIDKVVINGLDFESEAAGTFSEGVWNGTDCGPGYRQSDTLYCGGYFQYGHTVVEVLAEGATGEERMQLLIDGQVVQQWDNVAADFGGMRRRSYQFVHAGTLRPDQVTVAFVNDGASAQGQDRNLRVDRITLNNVAYESESAQTYSVGSWDAASGCAAGFKQSETLNCNGSFTYGTAPTFASAAENDGNDDDATNPALRENTRFYIVDAASDSAERFTHDATWQTDQQLHRDNKSSRGIAADATGEHYWTVDRTGRVFVYAADGTYEGNWRASGVKSAGGIATDGTDVWIVDSRTDEVYLFEGGASFRAGEHVADSGFAVVEAPRATGITTDGTHLWVVNSGKQDSVLRYSRDGALEATWQLDSANVSPTGITIDPTDVNDVWVVDGKRDEVFVYAGAAWAAGSQVFAAERWNVNGRNPQGIADPPPIAAALGTLQQFGSTLPARSEVFLDDTQLGSFTTSFSDVRLSLASLQQVAWIRIGQANEMGPLNRLSAALPNLIDRDELPI